MNKDNNGQICVNKTLVFLALIGVAVVLGVLTINKPVSTKSEAATTCNATQARINSGCEARRPTTITKYDGTTLTTKMDFTGRQCVLDSGANPPGYTWVNNTATCMPTVRCSYAGKVYFQQNQDDNYSFDYTNSDWCLLNPSDNIFGIRCNITRDPVSDVLTSASTKSDPICSPAKTFSCQYGGRNITDATSPKWVDTVGAGGSGNYKCITSTTGVNTGYRCKTDGLGGPINANGSVPDPVNCAAPARGYNCQYGGRNVTDTTLVYKWTGTDKCIVNVTTGATTGYSCRTDAGGNIIANGSKVNANCAAPASYSCQYGGKDVFNATSLPAYPYKWVDNNVGGVIYKCITNASNVSFGARCKTDAAGVINANGSVRDSRNCPVRTATCQAGVGTCSYGSKTVPSGQCITGTNGERLDCGCDPNRNLTYPSLYAVSGTCP